MTPRFLIVVPDIMAFFHETAFLLGRELRERGAQVVVAVTSPYYPRFSGVRFEDVGPTRYFSAFRDAPVRRKRDIDRWAVYPTYDRRRFFEGPRPFDWEECERLDDFFESIFAEEGPFTAVWSENVSGVFLFLAYAQAKRRGVPYYGYLSARVPGLFNVFLDAPGTRLLHNPAHDSAPLPAVQPPDWSQFWQNDLGHASVWRRTAPVALKAVRSMLSPNARSIEIGSPRAHQARSYGILLSRKLRHLRTRGLFEAEPGPAPAGLRVLYPLHYRPEASTSVMARHYGDEMEVVRNIAFSLPWDAQLLVKEHPAAVGLRPRSFYRDVRRLPGVRLLSPYFPMRDHLRLCDAVVTLSSSMGFEALLAGVPTLVLGDVFYGSYPGAQQLGSFGELEVALRGLAKLGERRAAAHDDVLRRYFRCCFPGDFNYLERACTAPDNVRLLARPLLDLQGGG